MPLVLGGREGVDEVDAVRERPGRLASYDEAALKIVSPSSVKHVVVGKEITLTRGSYRITMVGQHPDDNTL